MRYALIAILLGAALALADDEVEPAEDAAPSAQHEDVGADVDPTTDPADEAR